MRRLAWLVPDMTHAAIWSACILIVLTLVGFASGACDRLVMASLVT